MNAKRNALVLCCALIAGLSTTAAYGGDFFTDQGSIWAGGSFTYLNENIRGETSPMTMLMLSPSARYFPAKYFIVSPAFSWDLMTESLDQDNSYSSGTFAIGPELGFAFGNNIPVVPYVISGVQYTHQYTTSHYTSIDQFGNSTTVDEKSGADGWRIPLFGGVMIPLVNGLGIQVETGFTYNHSRDYSFGNVTDASIFSISIGVCGIGKNLGLSFLNTFTDLMF